MFQNVPMFLRLLSFLSVSSLWKTAMTRTATLCRKEKEQRNLFKFSCFSVYFCRIWIDLYLMISKRQRWDLVLKTLIWQHSLNLQFSLKERKIKSIASTSAWLLTCFLLSDISLSIALFKIAYRLYLEIMAGQNMKKKSKLAILISFSRCALCPSGSCVLDHLKV